jgi:hypothetical protein
MRFNKKKYWERRNNMVTLLDREGKPRLDDDGKEIKEHKPLRGQGEYPPLFKVFQQSPVTIGFTNTGELAAQNRAWRRKKVKLPGANTFTRSIKKSRKYVKPRTRIKKRGTSDSSLEKQSR